MSCEGGEGRGEGVVKKVQRCVSGRTGILSLRPMPGTGGGAGADGLRRREGATDSEAVEVAEAAAEEEEEDEAAEEEEVVEEEEEEEEVVERA
jgi:hypothetical protein